MTNVYSPPGFGKKAFNCCFCGTYAHHHWYKMGVLKDFHLGARVLTKSKCCSCNKSSLWLGEYSLDKNENIVISTKKGKLISPNEISLAPLSNPDMPEDIKSIYDEAASISSLSPSASAALLRKAIEKLVKKHIVSSINDSNINVNDNLNNIIGKLVTNHHIMPAVQEMLDFCRVIGNEAIHGDLATIQIKEENITDVIEMLFNAINMIIKETITRSKEQEKMMGLIPPRLQEAITNRNNSLAKNKKEKD